MELTVTAMSELATTATAHHRVINAHAGQMTGTQLGKSEIFAMITMAMIALEPT